MISHFNLDFQQEVGVGGGGIGGGGVGGGGIRGEGVGDRGIGGGGMGGGISTTLMLLSCIRQDQ